MPVLAGFGIRVALTDPIGSASHSIPAGWSRQAGGHDDNLPSIRIEPEGNGFVLWVDGDRTSVRPSDLAVALEAALDHLAIRYSPTHLFLHAGVVAWRDRALLIVGLSGAGKSTLTTHLARLPGRLYLSDERAAIDEDLLVWPAPVPVAVKDEQLGTVGRFPPEQLGLTVAQGPVPVGAALLATYQQGATWAPVRLSAGQAIVEILASTCSPRSEQLLGMLHRLADAVPVYQGRRGEAGQVASWSESLW